MSEFYCSDVVDWEDDDFEGEEWEDEATAGWDEGGWVSDDSGLEKG